MARESQGPSAGIAGGAAAGEAGTSGSLCWGPSVREQLHRCHGSEGRGLREPWPGRRQPCGALSILRGVCPEETAIGVGEAAPRGPSLKGALL